MSAVRRRLLGVAALVLALAVVAAVGRIIVPVAVQFVLDGNAGSPRAHAELVLRIAAVGATGIVLAGVASWAIHRIVVAGAESALADLRATALRRALRLAPEVLESTSAGGVVSRITGDVDTVSAYLSGGAIQLLQNLVQMLFAAAVMALYSWPLAVAVLLGVIPFLIAMQAVRRLVRRRFAHVRTAVADVHENVGEIVHGIEVIHSFGVAGVLRARSHAAVETVRAALWRTQHPLNANVALGEAASGTVTALVVAGAALLGAGFLPDPPTPGQAVAFLFLTTFFVRPLQFALTSLGEAQSAFAGVRRTRELLTWPVDVVDEHAGRALPDGPLHLDAVGVGFAYGDGTRALAAVDISIPFGQFVAVVGATGSGKSTLGKLLTRRLRATEGSVRLGGVDVDQLAATALARRVAVVPQSSFLFDGTVRDNLLLAAPDADDARVLEVADTLGLAGWIATLDAGLDTPVGQGGAALSAGERQLVALVRAALVDPAILVLDEATSSLDPQLDAAVQAAMHRITLGRTTVAIAHRLSTAERADRVLVMRDGHVVEDGPPDRLASAGGAYAELLAAWRRREIPADTVPTAQEST